MREVRNARRSAQRVPWCKGYCTDVSKILALPIFCLDIVQFPRRAAGRTVCGHRMARDVTWYDNGLVTPTRVTGGTRHCSCRQHRQGIRHRPAVMIFE
jgi:hypothetical protein